MLWVSWPKKSSGVTTDVSEGTVRAIGLAAGLVDVKICAVDEVWSGLKFVFRLQDRAKLKTRNK
jgi:Cu/Ag efflux protein CusF